MQYDWKTYWGSSHPSYDKQHQAVWKAILPKLRGQVADLGCGSCLMYKDSKVRLTGIDSEENFLLEAPVNYPQGDYYVADAKQTRLPDGYFDTVIFLGVLDYYEDWRPFIKEAERIKKIDGQILIVVMDGFRNHNFKKVGKKLVDNWYLIRIF